MIGLFVQDLIADMPRLPVLKTYKLFIGGNFPRTESGRVFSIKSDHRSATQVCRASKKDLRDAVVAAKKAQPDWSKRSGMNRGQVLYRIAEILESRSSEIADEIVRFTGQKLTIARREIQISIDRFIWYAGWSDKFTNLFGTVNPVASSHFNFSVPEPVGIVGLIAPDHPSFLGLIVTFY